MTTVDITNYDGYSFIFKYYDSEESAMFYRTIDNSGSSPTISSSTTDSEENKFTMTVDAQSSTQFHLTTTIDSTTYYLTTKQTTETYGGTDLILLDMI